MFLSAKEQRQYKQNLRQRYAPADALLDADASFGETFTASVGFVFDEELSISSLLNNDMYAQREAAVKELADSGVDLTPYQDRTGKLDYDRIAKDMPDAGVGTNMELFQQRRDRLAARRAYANDVKERGSGMAQFLGSMTGYLLDPVNVATLPIGASASVLRGLGTMARVRRVAAIEAGIGLVAETAIQPFVFAHKNEIGSPYSTTDAITAIATAAAGGAILGGATAGIAGFLRNVGGLADELPGNIDAEGARDVVMRMHDDIMANPERRATTDAIDDAARHYNARTSDEIAQEIVALRSSDEPTAALKLEVAETVLASRKGRWSSKVAGEVEAARGVERVPMEQRAALQQELATLRDTAEPDVNRIAEVEAQIEQIRAQDQQVPIDKRLQERLDDINHRRLVDVDTEYMQRLEAERTATKRASPDTYEVNREFTTPDDDSYLRAVDELADDPVIRVGEENVSAREFINERTIELEGLEAARVCAIG